MAAADAPWLSAHGLAALAAVLALLFVLLPRLLSKGGSRILGFAQLSGPGDNWRAACCAPVASWLNSTILHREIDPSLEKARDEDVEMTIIWLHPLGHENKLVGPCCPTWSPAGLSCPCAISAPEVWLSHLLPKARIIAPSSEAGPVSADDMTPCAEMPIRTWFDVYGKTPLVAYDESGIELAVERVNQLIEAEIARGTPSSRIVLAGASQGGALALTAALLCGRHKVAGVVTFASYVPLTRVAHHKDGQCLVPPPLSGINDHAPVLMMHGTEDSIIRPVYSELTVSTLRQLGMSDVELYALEGWGHGQNPFTDIGKKPSAADRLKAERLGISFPEDTSDAAHYVARWASETVRKSVAAAADTEGGKGGQFGPDGTGAEMTAGLIESGRPAVHRLYNEKVEAALPVFTLGATRCGTLGELTDVQWQLPKPEVKWDLDASGAGKAALTTNLFAAIALHEIETIGYILDLEGFPGPSADPSSETTGICELSPLSILRGDRGRTPLHAAVLAESALVTGLLITRGADPNVKDDDGHSALTLCLLPDDELTAIDGQIRPPRLLKSRGRATFALPFVVLGDGEMTDLDWQLVDTHYSFLAPHIRHYLSLDEAAQTEMKLMMDLKAVGQWKADEAKKKKGEKGERRTWPSGHRVPGFELGVRHSQEMAIFYGLFGGGLMFGCAVAEGYRHRWDELPFHPHIILVNVFLCLALHLHLRMSDPGYVQLPDADPTSGGDHPELEAAAAAAAARDGKSYCGLCKAAQPARTFHCKNCARCVCMRDHHCIWLDNCIGEANALPFFGFLALFTGTGWMAICDISTAFWVGTEEIQEKSGMVIYWLLWMLFLVGGSAVFSKYTRNPGYLQFQGCF